MGEVGLRGQGRVDWAGPLCLAKGASPSPELQKSGKVCQTEEESMETFGKDDIGCSKILILKTVNKKYIYNF